MMQTQKIVSFVALVSCLSSCLSRQGEAEFEYYDNGNVQVIRSFNSEGLFHGQSIWFYPNGFVKQQISFVNGYAQGHAVYFFEDGGIKSRRFYKNDKLDGFTTDYYNDSIGLIKNIVLFENGEVIDIRKGDTTFSIPNSE